MERDLELGSWSVRLGPSGWLRFGPALFLCVWLCGWAVGEAFALSALVVLVGGALVPGAVPPVKGLSDAGAGAILIGTFLALWVTFWTIGGLAAIRELLRLLWASDRLGCDGATLTLVRQTGPFRRRRTWSRDEIQRIHVRRRDRALVVDTPRGVHILTAYGTLNDRERLRDELRGLLGGARPAVTSLPGGGGDVPAGWEAGPDDSGGWTLGAPAGPRRRVAWVLGVLALALAVSGGASLWGHVNRGEIPPGAWGGYGFLAVLVAGLTLAAALSGGWRQEYGLRPGVIEIRRVRFGRRSSETRAVRSVRIHLTRDSDGDEWFALKVHGDARDLDLVRSMNDADIPLRLGRWVAGRLGMPLELDPGVAEEAA
jgi:hypothetical protein